MANAVTPSRSEANRTGIDNDNAKAGSGIIGGQGKGKSSSDPEPAIRIDGTKRLGNT